MKFIKLRIITTILLIVLFGLGFAKVLPSTWAGILALIVIVLNTLTQVFLDKKERKEAFNKN